LVLRAELAIVWLFKAEASCFIDEFYLFDDTDLFEER